MGQKWVFQDPVGNFTYTCQVNPNAEQGTFQKSTSFQATAAPNGALLLYEGTDQPISIVLTGTFFSQNQYAAMEYFYNLRNQFLVTDDLNRQRWCYCTEYEPTRVRNAVFQWKHTWSMTLLVIEEILPTGANEIFNANPEIG